MLTKVEQPKKKKMGKKKGKKGKVIYYSTT